MAKDPAFLFYPGDWLGGTMTMNRHQKGCYIDLLVAQFNIGPLSLETIKAVLGQDQASWTVLSKKFREDSAGNFFSERLVTEIEKRKEYCNKQSERVKKRWDKSGIYRGNTVVLPKIENKNENKDLVQCYDVEKELNGNKIQFEKICMIAGIKATKGKTELHVYHLWLTKNSKYPISRPAMYAGFESWLITGKRFKDPEEETQNGTPHNLKKLN